MKRSILASITGAVLTTIFIAGCGGQSSKVATPVDACELLTGDEISGAFARTFSAAEPGQSAGGGEKQGAMTSCSWESPGAEVAGNIGASLRNTVFINLMVWSWPAGSGGSENYMESFAEAAKTFNLPEPVPVALGDQAHWNGETMNVKKGDVTMSLSLTGPGDEATKRAAAENLMKTALGRL